MKTRSLIAILFILLAIAYCSMAATVVVKISQFPNTTAPAGSDLFLLASGATNKNITWNQLKDAIGTNPATVTIINNAYISNLFATNIYTSNLYATNITVNEFRGRTTFITNLFVDYITNNTAYITNLYSSNAFITNLYATLVTSNFFLFNTNIYLTNNFTTFVNNSFISNYFQTNVFQDTYVSNFFTTNNYMFVTNIQQFSTNLTVTNFYAGDTYVSNFFNTNIFVNNPAVSNFFVTNIYNAFAITSNFTFNVAWPLTNATLYGTTTFSPISGTVPGYISVLNGFTEKISLNGTNGAVNTTKLVVTNGITLKTNTWLGPTNEVNMEYQEYYYVAFTPCSVTNFSLTSGFGADHALLTITNASSSNITVRLPSGTYLPVTDTHPYTVTNSDVVHISIGYKQATPSVVVRPFHKLP